MSQHQITTERTWQGIPVKQLTNTETGQTELFAKPGLGASFPIGDVKVAESGANNQWEITNKPELLNRYNATNQINLSQQELDKLFYTDGTKIFNNDRASVINENSPYNTKTFLATKQNPVPGVTDPKTGITATQTSQTKAPSPPVLQDPPDVGTDSSAKNFSEAGVGEKSSLSIPTSLSDKQLSTIIGTSDNLIYPTGLGSNGQDFIEFTMVNYGTKEFQDIYKSQSESEKLDFKIGTRDLEEIKSPRVYLPIQPSINDQNDIGWGEDKMTPIQAYFANIATTGKVEDMMTDLQAAANLVGEDSGYGKLLRRYIGGQAVGINPIARTDGLVLNPNLELLFSGPSLRPFNFTFRLSPRSDTEATTVKRIIKFFKYGSTVRTTSDGLFLKAPYVFNIKYKFKDSSTEHPGLNKIKTCALRTISVNYTPDGSYMTFEDGTMTSYEIALQFSELEPVYDTDYKDYSHQIGY